MQKQIPVATEDAERSGSVGAVVRALKILDAFAMEDGYLSLAELSARCGMHKTTVLRLARTLGEAHYLVHREDGAWRLGPAAGWLGARYQASFELASHVEPILQEISQHTGESAVFYVREGNSRICLFRVEGPHAVRFHVRIGQELPLDKGSAGKVILAFSGAPGEEFDEIRRTGYWISIGERDPDVASIAAPVYGDRWQLVGAISISAPASRMSRKKILGHAGMLVRLANQLSVALGGRRVVQGLAGRRAKAPA